jgi:hypothetical protein
MFDMEVPPPPIAAPLRRSSTAWSRIGAASQSRCVGLSAFRMACWPISWLNPPRPTRNIGSSRRWSASGAGNGSSPGRKARQIREMASFMRSAETRNWALGAGDSLAHESPVAEVGLMLRFQHAPRRAGWTTHGPSVPGCRAHRPHWNRAASPWRSTYLGRRDDEPLRRTQCSGRALGAGQGPTTNPWSAARLDAQSGVVH